MSLKSIFYKSISIAKYQRVKYVYNNKINNILKGKSTKPLEKEKIKEIRQKYKEYGFNHISIKWHRFYNSLIDNTLIDFVPELLFYTEIEPALNQAIMYPALEDKNLLDKFFPSSFLPETIIKNINGYYYCEDKQISLQTSFIKCLEHSQFVIKPSIGTAGGEGVKMFDLSEIKDKTKFLESIFKEYNSDFIIQKVLTQDTHISKLNKSSINTIRVISYMRKDEVIPLSSVIRIGRNGEFTDNLTLGGVAVGIKHSGELRSSGYDKYGKRYFESDNGTIFKNFKITNYDKILSNVKDKHKNMPYFKLISWDISVNLNLEVKMVEFNALGQDINLHQMCNGPLFGKYFEEILLLTKNYNSMKQLMKYGK